MSLERQGKIVDLSELETVLQDLSDESFNIMDLVDNANHPEALDHIITMIANLESARSFITSLIPQKVEPNG